MRSAASSAAVATASAGASPQRPRIEASEVHIASQKPPLRPLGPRPQTGSDSSRTMRASGASRWACQAVHMPV